jgi:hypothetical protein
MRYKSALFWKTGRLLQVFSTGTENGGFTGFFIEYVKNGEKIGARFGRIFFRLLLSGIEGCQEVKTGLGKKRIFPC